MKPGEILQLVVPSRDQAIIEASRCLVCYDAPCEKACPAGVRVATFMRRIRFGDFSQALRKIAEKNILAGTCGMTCPRGKLCEEACVLNSVGSGIRIREVQLCAFVFGRQGLIEKARATEGKRVAIIGCGPAGIACAYYLRRAGIEPVIFEKRDSIGGLITSAIPAHRLIREVVAEELELATEGIEIRKGVDPGNLSKAGLASDGFDAIFLATGLWQQTSISIEGREAAIDGFALLSSLAEGKDDFGKIRGKIGVIGGGNTACDVALTLKLHTDSDVTVLYRRSRDEMPAFAHQVEEALVAGVRFEFNVAPLSIASKGRQKRLFLARTKPGPVDESGRAKPLLMSGSEFAVDFDHVVLATGRSPDVSWLMTNFNLSLDAGRLKVNEETLMTAEEGVFAGGDLIRKKGLVVDAVADGRKAATAILRYLKD